MRALRIAPMLLAAGLALLPSIGRAAANLQNQGGPVMVNPRVHLIFWLPPGYHLRTDGNADTDAVDMALIGQFIQDLGASAYFNIVSQYCSSNGCPGTVSLASSILYTQPYPNVPIQSNADVTNAVFVNVDLLQIGLSDIYVVLLGVGVQQSGEPNYHAFFSSPFTDTPIIYALVPGTSTVKPPVPNGPADNYITFVAHELLEAVTDPLVFNGLSNANFEPAWLDPTNNPPDQGEIADRCQFSRHAGTQQPDGADLVMANGDEYLVQEMWSNAAIDPTHFGLGGCQMSNPAITLVSPNSGPNGGGTFVVLLGGIFDADLGFFGTSGGTQVSFGGVPATNVFCPAPNICFATTPPAYPSGSEDGSPPSGGPNGGPLNPPNRVPVNVTVGGFTSATEEAGKGGPTFFSYDAGPACFGSLQCPAVILRQPPNLSISCPEPVFFWDQNGKFVGSGTTYTELTGDPGDGIYACTCQLPPRRICQRFGCCPPGPGTSCTFFNATVPPSQWCTSPAPPPGTAP